MNAEGAGAAVSEPLELDAAARALLADAAQWRLIGLLFERPRPMWWGEVARLGGDVEDAGLRAAAAAAHDANEGEYLDVLGPGALSAREVTHVPVIEPGRRLAELGAFYQAFAYQPVTEEPLDHLSVEAGFFAYLRFKQAYALASGDDEHAQVTGEAADAFLAEHLAPCAAGVAHPLLECAVEHLRLVAQVVAARVGPPRVLSHVMGDDDEGCGLTCGVAAPEAEPVP